MGELCLWDDSSVHRFASAVVAGASIAGLRGNPDLETVLTGSRQRIEKLDYRATGRLTRVEGNGKRVSYSLSPRLTGFPMVCVCYARSRAWLREDESSSAHERERARDHRGGTSWREGR